VAGDSAISFDGTDTLTFTAA